MKMHARFAGALALTAVAVATFFMGSSTVQAQDKGNPTCQACLAVCATLTAPGQVTKCIQRCDAICPPNNP